MFRSSHYGRRIFGLTASILIAGCAIAVGQVTTTDLPTDCSAYASIPLPAEAEKVPVPKTAPSCSSYRSYRGIGHPVNYSDARACAWQERLAQQANLGFNPKDTTASVVGGSLILADIYFNGAGVQRNVPLAMRFACDFEESTAILALQYMAKLNSSSGTHGPFEFCDYAATTFTENFCTDYKSQVEDDRRIRYYNSLKSSMTPEQKTAFEKLLDAENAYVNEHALEVYQGGTIRGMRTTGSMDILDNLFHTEVVHFERKEWPVLSDTQVTTADAVLHRQYEKTLQKIRTRPKDEFDDGEVTADHVSDVEKSWETYRDTWVAFARLRYPSAAAVIRAEITLRRYLLLKTIS